MTARVLTVFWHTVESDSIPDDYRDGSSPTVSVFTQQIRFLREHYTPISIDEFLDMVDGRGPMRHFAKPPILLGFDDGFKNVIVNALPVLREYEAPATLFVIGESLRDPGFVPWFIEATHLLRKTNHRQLQYGTDIVDLDDPRACAAFKRKLEGSFRACKSQSERNRLLFELSTSTGLSRPRASELDDDLRLIGKEDLKVLDLTSPLSIGSHAMTHRHLGSLTYEEQRAEAEQSDAILRERCPAAYRAVIAYPGGSCNRDTLAIAQTIYRAGFAVLLGSSVRNRYAYPRVGISGQTVPELAYLLSERRLNYILPIKRLLHTTHLRRME